MIRIIAGSCSLESMEQALTLAKELKKRGIKEIRAALFKPRTDPKSFQGLGFDGLEILEKIREMGLKTVTEVTYSNQINRLYPYVDVFQVGARNMQNFELLKDLGHTDKPIILKRGFASTVEEWLKAAEYIESGGNRDITLCERGIRGYDDITRNVLDIGAIIYIKQNTNYKIIADPSHSMGKREYVRRASLAAVAAGADGLLIETHMEPEKSISDARQTIHLSELDKILEDVWKK